MCLLFESLIKLILIYGSDVWGMNKHCISELDKMYLWFIRNMLKVKRTTSNQIVFGECGVYPPSVSCHVNVLCFYNRVTRMSDNSIVKRVFTMLYKMHEIGFNNWVSKVHELARSYKIHENLSDANFKLKCQGVIKDAFKTKWINELNDIKRNPILRLYKTFKTDFKMEPYLLLVKNYRYRIALTKLRASSHTLQIERGRYTRPKTLECDRLCAACNLIENEIHFVTNCTINSVLRCELYGKIRAKNYNFDTLNDKDKCIYLLKSEDVQVLTWLGKFVYKSFIMRDQFIGSLSA